MQKEILKETQLHLLLLPWQAARAPPLHKQVVPHKLPH